MKLGIVGTGFIAQEVVPQLRSWGIEPTAVCGTPQTKDEVDELCRKADVRDAFYEYKDMLLDGEIDTVYVAVPNFLHYSFVKQALEAKKNVIVEKPMTSNDREAVELGQIAQDNHLFLFEAITTVYLKNYEKIKEWLPRIGTVKLATVNYSQYSRRYDAFREGTILPAFDPKKSGGALMDLNLYNLHYLIGLFGEPKDVRYEANIERGIDTSGIVYLDYDSFKAVSIAAKDCAAPAQYVIQGTEGYILQTTSANHCGAVTLHLNNGTEEIFDAAPETRLRDEFETFRSIIDNNDYDACMESLKHSTLVSKVQTKARMTAGIKFPADEEG